MIQVTEKAAEMLKDLISGQDNQQNKLLRVSMGGYG